MVQARTCQAEGRDDDDTDTGDSAGTLRTLELCRRFRSVAVLRTPEIRTQTPIPTATARLPTTRPECSSCERALCDATVWDNVSRAQNHRGKLCFIEIILRGLNTVHQSDHTSRSDSCTLHISALWQDLGEKLKDFDKSTSTVAAKDDKLRTTTRTELRGFGSSAVGRALRPLQSKTGRQEVHL